MTRTVFMARSDDGTYFNDAHYGGPIDDAMIFLTRGHAEFELAPSPTFGIIKFKLVEIIR